MKTKILILCDYYLPSVRAGGPVRSISAIVDALKNDFDITIVTRNYDIGMKTPFNEQELKHDGYQVRYFANDKLMRGIRDTLVSTHFDIIYFNSFVAPQMTIFTLLYLFFKRKPRLIISPRGELGKGALLIKSTRKKIYIALFKKLFLKSVEFFASSDSEKNEIQYFLGKKTTVTVLPNLTSHVKSSDVVNLKKENEINIVFLSRIARKKNLLCAIQILMNVKGRVNFDVIGPIEDQPYWDECQAVIKQLPAHIRVTYRGLCDPNNVITTLKPYDLFFLSSWNENYGHVIVESLAAGCPVLISDQTPWHNLIDHEAGWEFALSTPALFSEKINQLIMLNNTEYSRYKNAAAQYYTNNIANNALENDYINFFKAKA